MIVYADKPINLEDIPTRAPEGFTKKEAKKNTDRMARTLGDLQHMLYAEEKHCLMVVFQGMDASGKDGATRKVFSYCSPSGVWAYAFKKPTEHEFAHDFLWRVHDKVPRKGRIQIFNRSHYEDVLIQRVHKWISEEHAETRIDAINAFEELLQFDNNTTIVKFYMHISRGRQKEKLQERIDNPRKNWKHNSNDWKEAELWDEYMRCYERAINRSTIPWYIVPVDQRWYRDYLICDQLIKILKGFEMKLPGLQTE
jgi:PPK2 family polyphosphate:nucleotide phosphotransferase